MVKFGSANWFGDIIRGKGAEQRGGKKRGRERANRKDVRRRFFGKWRRNGSLDKPRPTQISES